MTTHLYLSPHYDDVALSCGGLMHQQAQLGQTVLAATLCAAPPIDPLSPYAARMHARWDSHLQPQELVMARQAEDGAAMQQLGATPHYFSFHDAIYRGYPEWYYQQSGSIFGPLHTADLALIPLMVAACQTLTASVIYAPLGVGHHVDHQLTHLVAWQLMTQGCKVYFYEDYPYSDPAYPFNTVATRPDDNHRLQARLNQIMSERRCTLMPHLSPLSEQNIQAKARSICAYTSQIGTLFGETATVLPRIQAYAHYVGLGQWAERYWSL